MNSLDSKQAKPLNRLTCILSRLQSRVLHDSYIRVLIYAIQYQRANNKLAIEAFNYLYSSSDRNPSLARSFVLGIHLQEHTRRKSSTSSPAMKYKKLRRDYLFMWTMNLQLPPPQNRSQRNNQSLPLLSFLNWDFLMTSIIMRPLISSNRLSTLTNITDYAQTFYTNKS